MARNPSATAPATASSTASSTAPAAASSTAPSTTAPSATAPSATAPATAPGEAARARARAAAAAAFKGLDQRSTLIAVHGAMGALADAPALPLSRGLDDRLDRAAAALLKAARSCFRVSGDAVIPADELAAVMADLLVRAAREADLARGDRLSLKASSRTVDAAIKTATRGL